MKPNNRIFRIFISLIFVSVFVPFMPVEGAMTDYCVTPPFISQSIPPNVLIVLDNSGSMCDQAYAGSYDPAKFSNGQYYGYFDGAKNYKYTNNGRWEQTTDAMTTGTATQPIANGSFLNWATMRRVEVAKRLLLGGKANPRSWNGSVTVKLTAETGCNASWDFQKDFDTSAGNLIYPFVGNYRFTRSSDDLDVTPLAGGATNFQTYPSADISVPAGWTEYPAAGAMDAWTKVDEVSSDGNTTYIQNNNTTNPVLFDYDYTQSKPAGIITVTVKVTALKTASGSTRNISGVLRIGGMNYVSNTSSLDTSYSTYSFTWTSNPVTGLPWAWSDIKSSGVGSIEGFGVQAGGNYTSRYPRITQVYLDLSIAVPTGTDFNTIVDMGSGQNATGIMDTLTNDVKFGLAYYESSSNGGAINTDVDFGTPSSMITSIMNMSPSTWTPLGETLYEMTRYFRQDAPYYANAPADYKTGLSYDPYYYKYSSLGLGIADRYVPCAKSFILFLTDGESTQDTSMPGSATSSPYSACTLTNIKACSGYGIPDADGSNTGHQRFAGTTVGQTYASSGTDYLIDVAYWARTNDMRPGACTTVPTAFQQCLPNDQNITLYSVYMFGSGSRLLKDAAIYGGFNDLNNNNKPDCTTVPNECYKETNGDGVVSTGGVCSNDASISCTDDIPCTLPGTCRFDDPITYYEGEDGYELQRSITQAISDILRRVTSGTAASVLASGEGSGANLVQATYYPKRVFGSDEISWIGSMQNLWYYVDPYFSFSNIREEGGTTKDYILDLLADGTSNSKMDYVLRLYYDSTDRKAMAERLTDDLGTGMTGTLVDKVVFEKLGNLWNAGPLLWSRDLSTSPRTIKTWIDKNNNGIVNAGEFIDFSTPAFNALSASDKTVMRTYLQAGADNDLARRTISYVSGYDKFCTGTATPCMLDANCTSPATCSGSGFRSRTVAMDLNGDNDVLDAGEEPKVWKLGDIINSTPQISSWLQLNGYNTYYADASYTAFVKDTGSTLPLTSTARYQNRGMVFVGANDGMLHAFRLGKLGLDWKSKTSTQKATLGKYCVDKPSTACVVASDCPSGLCASETELGKEIWAYIPKNVLPYLKYMYDTAYCHITSVDLAPYIFDASIEGPATTCADASGEYWKCPKNVNSWRTIIIGGMRYGGACKTTAYGGAQGVKVPVTGEGYSSYFALDITDPYDPQLLWEFSDADLGTASSGPAIVRISSRTASGATSGADTPTTTDGRWFVVFGSGPTGSINTADRQFMGNSDQPLRVFILDLKTGTRVRTIDTGITNAYAGSMINVTQDADLDYQDDVVYIPYVRKCVGGDTAAICNSADGNWNNGGVLRLLTNEDLAGNNVSGVAGGTTALNPANWQYSRVIDNAGPVTSSIVRLQDKKTGKLWLYFGTGRYFFKVNNVIDDAANVRNLYGLKDPCFDGGAFSASCLAGTGASYTASQLASIDLTSTSGVTDDEGWKITLDDCSDASGTTVACSSAYFRTERVITNPLTTATGLVFFTTLKPYDDVCSSGGSSAIWAVKYDTGGAPGTLLQGKALIQVSTGAIEQKDLSTAFTKKSGRKTDDIQGVPPTSQGLSIMTQPSPVKRVIHTRER